MSFDGWDVWEFIKGRKKTAVTLIGATLGWIFGDTAQNALIAGAVVEGVWAVAEYWYKAR